MIDASEFVAGALCLDFINTVGGTRAGVHTDKLETYGDLLDWAVLGGALTRADAARLGRYAADEPDTAGKVLMAAKAFREALHAVFAAQASQDVAPKPALDLVNAWIGQSLAHARLVVREGEGFAWGWDRADAPDAPLWAIARDAGELLTKGPLDRLTECASDTCGWLFLDSTKNHSRRWCDMRGCGNRDKVRRYRQRPEPRA
jgi:predicted RNA-binding Zn ribbon-like protein